MKNPKTTATEDAWLALVLKTMTTTEIEHELKNATATEAAQMRRELSRRLFSGENR